MIYEDRCSPRMARVGPLFATRRIQPRPAGDRGGSLTVCDVLELGDPRLRVRSAEVPDQALEGQALQDLVKDLIETMRARNGAGIAAPQIGVAQRVCVIEVNDNPRYPYKPTIPLTVLINPTLERIGEETISVIEGCLSVPNLRGRVERAARVRVRAHDERGRCVELHAEGLTAGDLTARARPPRRAFVRRSRHRPNDAHHDRQLPGIHSVRLCARSCRH